MTLKLHALFLCIVFHFVFLIGFIFHRIKASLNLFNLELDNIMQEVLLWKYGK